MIGERLSEVRKNFKETQADLAAYLQVSLSTIRSWEQEKSSPDHEFLVKICKHYHVSSDFLLGLSNIDPVYEQQQRLKQFSDKEIRQLKDFEEFLLWKKKRT